MVDRKGVRARMQADADESGFFLCPDMELLKELLDGLVMNEERYAYGSCPCRISSGIKDFDVDIICPCEYRDADINEFGMCYCGLFVSEKVKDDPKMLEPIPERRPEAVIDLAVQAKQGKVKVEKVEAPDGGVDRAKGIPVWRCKVCGYLAARDMPPPVCPICKAKRDRFERFSFG